MTFLKKTFSEFSSDNCTTLAAALAYYTAFALPPLLYLLLTLLTLGMSTVYESGEAEAKAQDTIENQAAAMIGNQEVSDEIASILDKNRESGGAWWKTIISFAGILVGATGVVAALQTSLNLVWEVKPDPQETGILDVIWKRIFSLGMILGLAFLLILSLVVSTVLTGVGDQLGSMLGMSGLVAQIINYVVQALVVFVVFASIFKFMPDAEVEWRDVGTGALVTTILFLLGRVVLQLYFQFSNPAQQLGSAAASLAVLLAWVYYSAMIVLLGAEATQVYANMFGSGIQPEPHAVKVEERLHRPTLQHDGH